MEKDLFNKTESFSELYYAVRNKEGRVYPDDAVRRLPIIEKSHPHYKEWLVRKNSWDKLRKYIDAHKNPSRVLDVGCGNGWLSARLAKTFRGKVTGIDIHSPEIEQAARVFENIPNLQFIQGNLSSSKLEGKKFDLIIFTASIQYFASLSDILSRAQGYLEDDGEIHIMDSFFYKPGEIEAARERTTEYFSKMGFPEMAYLYFHHCEDGLKKFNAELLYNPKSIISKLTRSQNPFPWIRIRK